MLNVNMMTKETEISQIDDERERERERERRIGRERTRYKIIYGDWREKERECGSEKEKDIYDRQIQ